MRQPLEACVGTALAVLMFAGIEASGAELSDQAALQRAQSPPAGLPPLAADDIASLSAEKIALGRRLFFDARLSADGRMACATCHAPEQAFTQRDRATPAGESGQPLRRTRRAS